MSVELFAVNAVSDLIAACPKLAPDIHVGDKTPITDGHIDIYTSAEHSKKNLVGRVPLQVKGRVTSAKVKSSRGSQSFQVEREVLQFFRNHGGGLYFYVPMREGGAQREVFYAILLPFKIGRLTEGSPESQKTFSIQLTRLPKEKSQIEKIVRLGWEGRSQSAVGSGNANLLDQVQSLTVHSLEGFDESRPTRLALAETDFVVVARLQGGLEMPLDIDLDILPQEYLERDLAVPVGCGAVEFTNATGRRIDPRTLLVKLSEGLQIRFEDSRGTISASLDLTPVGSFKDQAKNFDFMLAAASGNALTLGSVTHDPIGDHPKLAAELQVQRDQLARLIELFDAFGVDDELTSSFELDDETRRTLLTLHKALVEDSPVRGTADGTGRLDISLGAFKIMLIVMPPEDEDKDRRRLVDPFDPAKRSRFRIYRAGEDGTPEPFEWGTVYEAITPEDLASVLNLRLHGLVEAYSALDDRPAATNHANHMVLRLLAAADLTSYEGHRNSLLRGATELSSWLLAEDPDTLAHRINYWQIHARLGTLSAEDQREIRAARRSLDNQNEQAKLLEACMLLLLGDIDELEIVVSELGEDEIARLQTWPIWNFAGPLLAGPHQEESGALQSSSD